MLTDLVSDEDPHSGLQMAIVLFPHVVEREGDKEKET